MAEFETKAALPSGAAANTAIGLTQSRAVAAGGFSSIFFGLLPFEGRQCQVAVKQFNTGSKKQDYEAELKAMQAVQAIPGGSQRFVQLLDQFQDDAKGQFLLVYEQLPAGDLSKDKNFARCQTAQDNVLFR